MNSTGIVKTVDRLRWIIKLVFGLLLKFILLLVWGISLWVFCNLLYDRYVLEAYSLRDYLPVLILCFGNIWALPWVILWYEKLYPAFDKPNLYYRVKAWFISLKEQSTVGMCVYNFMDFFIKLCVVTYGTIVVIVCFISAFAILALVLLRIVGWIFR